MDLGCTFITWLIICGCRDVVSSLCQRRDCVFSSVISVKSHEYHCISDHRQLHYLFNNLFLLWNTGNIKDLHWQPVVKEIHRWPMFSTHKGPAIRKLSTCYDVIMRTSALINDWLGIPLGCEYSKHLGTWWTNEYLSELTMVLKKIYLTSVTDFCCNRFLSFYYYVCQSFVSSLLG